MEFQNCGSEHAPMYGVHTNEELERFVNICISCDVSLLPMLHKMHNNTNTHVHVRKKPCL
jgi:hypothetical protein